MRATRAYQLRHEGCTYDFIARQLGYAGSSSARKATLRGQRIAEATEKLAPLVAQIGRELETVRHPPERRRRRRRRPDRPARSGDDYNTWVALYANPPTPDPNRGLFAGIYQGFPFGR